MPQRKELFENGEIYHITARRINENLLFKSIDDYYRGIFSIYEFNTTASVEIRECRKERARIKISGVPDSANSDAVTDKRDKLVEILCFCFMPNHIHLLIRQLKDGGISKFMNKFGSGYSRYFKDKYKLGKKGYFFDSRFNSVHIKTEDQLRVIFTYIHANPISLIEPNWKEKGIKNPNKVIEFLENYKWSSYQDYIGKKNFPSITEREFLSEIMDGLEGCRKNIEDWVKYKGEIKDFADLSFEN